LHVAPGHRVGDLAVEEPRERPLHRARGPRRVRHDLGGEELGQKPLDVGVAARQGQGLVEQPVALDEHVGRVGVLLQHADTLVERVEVVLAGPQRGELRYLRLDDAAELERVLEAVPPERLERSEGVARDLGAVRGGDHAAAAAALDGDEAEQLEDPDRLAHRSPAHPELLSQRPLRRQPLAGPDAAPRDGEAEVLEHALEDAVGRSHWSDPIRYWPDHCQDGGSSSISRAGPSGMRVTRPPAGPTASSIAEARTAGTGSAPDSPTPLSPSGFSGDGVSRWSITMVGT